MEQIGSFNFAPPVGEFLSISWVGSGGPSNESEQTRMVWTVQFALIEMVPRLGPDT